MKYYIVTKCHIGPTEWSEEEIWQNHPVAVFEEPKKLREWMIMKRKELKDGEISPYGIYSVKWIEGRPDPLVGHWIEGMPSDEDKDR
jgi:hypothetical protein